MKEAMVIGIAFSVCELLCTGVRQSNEHALSLSPQDDYLWRNTPLLTSFNSISLPDTHLHHAIASDGSSYLRSRALGRCIHRQRQAPHMQLATVSAQPR